MAIVMFGVHISGCLIARGTVWIWDRVDLGACGFGFCDPLGAVCHRKSGSSALNPCQTAADLSLLTESGNLQNDDRVSNESLTSIDAGTGQGRKFCSTSNPFGRSILA